MNTEQIISIAFLILQHLIIPLLLIYWVGFRASKSKFDLIFKLVTVWPYFVFLFYAGRWDFIPYMLRYIILILLVFTSIKGFISFKELAWFKKKNVWGWLKMIGQFVFFTLFFLISIVITTGFKTEEKGIDIGFPLKHGFVGHGGNTPGINYHNEDTTAQQYALDIVKLNSFGLRAKGFFPEDLTKFAIYGDTIFSPCDSKVVVLKEGIDNMPSGIMDKVNLAGNCIVLEYNNHLIVFAHILKNSISVQIGDYVKKGQPIARVGNSGHTSEPHLHIHAIQGTDTNKILKGNGIPIYFNGKFLIRNDTW